MAHSPAARMAVRDAYVAGATLAMAAQRAGVSEATARAWKKAAVGAEGWDRLRAARSLISGGHAEMVQKILGDFLSLHHEVIQQIRSLPAEEQTKQIASLTDSLSKTMAALGRATPELSRLGIALDVLHKEGEFIRAHYPRLAPTFLEMLEPFSNQLVKEYG
ncbi:MAG: DUF1804 family protein [Magnetococcales bacterium]|nr:DUF1804 family protein [Magnetococcales bacterium]